MFIKIFISCGISGNGFLYKIQYKNLVDALVDQSVSPAVSVLTTMSEKENLRVCYT